MKRLEKFLSRKDIPPDVRKALRKEFEERERVEDALRKHVQMIDFADDTIMIRNLEDRIIYWNKGAQRLYGWTKGEALGKYVHSFLKTVFPESVQKAVRTCLRSGFWEGELRHIRRDGTQVTVASRWTLQKDESGQPVAFLEINNDITELKKAEKAILEVHNQLELRVEERTAELKAANARLQQLITERKRLEKEILEISGLEQRRIGQDLHDGLSQQLTGIAFMGKVLEQKLLFKSKSEASHVKKIVDLVNEAIAQTRALARGLVPVELESNGLMSALQELVSNTESLFQIPCQFICEKPILIHNHTMAVHLYRIAQEAVNNAVKHSKTPKIGIILKSNGTNIILEVKDDGIGFPKNPRKMKISRGMGLRIMGYRAEMINAALDISGNNGKGTTVSCSLPKRSIIKKYKGEVLNGLLNERVKIA